MYRSPCCKQQQPHLLNLEDSCSLRIPVCNYYCRVAVPIFLSFLLMPSLLLLLLLLLLVNESLRLFPVWLSIEKSLFFPFPIECILLQRIPVYFLVSLFFLFLFTICSNMFIKVWDFWSVLSSRRHFVNLQMKKIFFLSQNTVVFISLRGKNCVNN